MQTRFLTVVLESPLAVGSGRDRSNRTSTPAVVPPQTVRGAMAAALDRAGCDEETMQSVFGPSGCRTSGLVPAANGEDSTATAPRPAPLTLRTCKRYSGFRGEENEGAAHGAEDALLANLQLVLEGDAAAMERLRACSKEGCRNVLVQKGGLVRRRGEGYATQPAPDRRTQTHVGIDRRRDGAEGGVLYTQEVLNEETVVSDAGLVPTRFRARVVASEQDMGPLQDVLGADDAELRVGTSISRGLGRCRVAGFGEAEGQAPVEERVHRFNDAWAARSTDAGEQALVAITLDTPALFVDSFLRPNTTPGGSDLLQAAGSGEAEHREALSGLERVHEVARPYRLQAWNGLAGFPHGTDQGIQAGSVLVYATSELSEGLLAALRHIETAGVGLRRELGLGQVRVCDPIHTSVHEHTGVSASTERAD